MIHDTNIQFCSDIRFIVIRKENIRYLVNIMIHEKKCLALEKKNNKKQPIINSIEYLIKNIASYIKWKYMVTLNKWSVCIYKLRQLLTYIYQINVY